MPTPPADRLAFARGVLRAESAAVAAAADRLGAAFLSAVDLLLHCEGRVAVVGVGKSADVGAKLAGTLNSTGTRAYTLDATRAVHGDLGMVHPDDVALLLSHSGESDEIVRLIGPLRKLCAALVAVTGNPDGTLARAADAAVVYGPVAEACPLALAPSSSTTVMLALGDAVAFSLMQERGFTADDFARFHPAGNLGRRLATVADVMRTGHELRVAPAAVTVRTVFARVRHEGRRTGAVMLVDDAGRLAGLFTDSDLARLLEAGRDAALDEPVERVMTKTPVVVGPAARVGEALDLLRGKKISELPVVDAAGRPVGMIDITDLIGLAPAAPAAEPRPQLRLADRRSA
jgi:arabinose-5-phosphate isomerase